MRYICNMNWKRISRTLAAVLALVSCKQYEGRDLPTVPEGSVILSPRLSNQRVNGFAQDRDGHIWIATQRGLNMFTGDEYYQYYSTDDTLGLPDNQITAILATQNGDLWAGSVNGVALRSSRDCSFQRIPFPSKGLNINQILETPSGEILFSSGNILFRYNRETESLQPVIRDFNSFTASARVVSPSCSSSARPICWRGLVAVTEGEMRRASTATSCSRLGPRPSVSAGNGIPPAGTAARAVPACRKAHATAKKAVRKVLTEPRRTIRTIQISETLRPRRAPGAQRRINAAAGLLTRSQWGTFPSLHSAGPVASQASPIDGTYSCGTVRELHPIPSSSHTLRTATTESGAKIRIKSDSFGKEARNLAFHR